VTLDREEKILEVSDIVVSYGSIEILHGISLHVKRGEIVALLGPNSAGKTTLMYAIAGVLPILAGRILFNRQPIHNLPPEQVAKLDITLIPEGRLLFGRMKILENLELGAYRLRGKEKKAEIRGRINEVLKLFPALQEKKEDKVWTLSGGQQQMVAIGRGLMSRPKLLLLDEPSLGLAPILVRESMETLVRLKEQGLSILISEQNSAAALRIADRGYVMGDGRIIMEDSSKNLASADKIKAAYFGNLSK
jgi:branched-chain amino acid transport system ATP-binding protein